jgi:hypothetical protein
MNSFWERHMSENHALFAVQPLLIERRCGGWLALTPEGWPLAVGVTGDTKEEAQKIFGERE